MSAAQIWIPILLGMLGQACVFGLWLWRSGAKRAEKDQRMEDRVANVELGLRDVKDELRDRPSHAEFARLEEKITDQPTKADFQRIEQALENASTLFERELGGVQGVGGVLRRLGNLEVWSGTVPELIRAAKHDAIDDLAPRITRFEDNTNVRFDAFERRVFALEHPR